MVRTRKTPLAFLAGVVLTIGLLALVQWLSGDKPAQGQVPVTGLTATEVKKIIAQAVAKANKTASSSGLRSIDAVNGPRRTTKMCIAVVARDGQVLETFSMSDAWVGAQDLAIAKARTASFFSSNENGLTSRIIGILSQSHNPDGSGGAGPLWGIWASNQAGIGGNGQLRNGLAPMPGGLPLYKGGNTLVGGVGVAGDAVDQDEAVAFAAAIGFLPGPTVVKLGFSPPAVPGIP